MVKTKLYVDALPVSYGQLHLVHYHAHRQKRIVSNCNSTSLSSTKQAPLTHVNIKHLD
ncbi:hypothetical protein DPMN_014939 [Dreissena polymorpha]|uniref:Uncharacterized protein n=1 Tax=Dreissena polymorpha TaxID=45954 RepID=A0A9D4S523_DREPO|nr:hypothetical protein DPMN_014939 [Dreissena polymorpha]